MIHAWLLDYRPLPPPLASAAAAAAAPLAETLAHAAQQLNGNRPESVALITCHRCEVYTHQVSPELVDRLLRTRLPEAAYRTVCAISGDPVVRHLMRVAAGLESMLLGETEVQGQVVAALAAATTLGSAGPVMDALFRAAIHTGKRARTVTGIGRCATSLAAAAVDLVAARAGSLAQLHAVVLGAGTMARQTCERLHALGVGSLTVINRTLARARHLAAGQGGRALPWEHAAGALAGADLAIAATAATEPIIDRLLLQAVMADRARRPLHLVDLAVPQNVAADARAVAGVHHYDFTALEAATRASHAARAAEVPRVEAIIAGELERFGAWLRQHQVAPTLRMLGELAAAARDAELERVWRRLPDLSERERRAVESLAHNLAHRLLRTPMARLRSAAGSSEADNYRIALDYLFAQAPGAPGDPAG